MPQQSAVKNVQNRGLYSDKCLRQEWDPSENVLAEVPHGAAGERGVGVDVLIVVEPLCKFDLEPKV